MQGELVRLKFELSFVIESKFESCEGLSSLVSESDRLLTFASRPKLQRTRGHRYHLSHSN